MSSHPQYGGQVPPTTPPIPPIPPTTPEPPQSQPPRRRRRAGIVALALVAGLAGGAGGVAIDHATGSTPNPTASPSSTTAQQTANDTSPSSVSAVAAAVSPSVVEVKVTLPNGEEIGSGVVLTSDGEILTNNHVVADAANGQGTITVVFSNGKKANATIVGRDASSDLALIKAQGVSGLKPATLGDSSTVQVGDQVLAVGSPEGLQGTVTEGIVSYLNRQVTVQSSGSSGFPWEQPNSSVTYNAIQTDASINPGNSGGPLVNMAGQVVGINSAIYSPTSATGGEGGSVGLGFAIPINQAKSIIASLENGGSA